MGVVLLLALAACGGPTREDYRAAATSARAVADRDLHGRWTTNRSAELQEATSWAEWGPATIRITCQVDHATSFRQADPGTVTCVSSVAKTIRVNLGESWTGAGTPRASSDLFTHTTGPNQHALIID
jgi:hypothetical protein